MVCSFDNFVESLLLIVRKVFSQSQTKIMTYKNFREKFLSKFSLGDVEYSVENPAENFLLKAQKNIRSTSERNHENLKLLW